MDRKIDILTARFRSPETEDAYQDFIHDGDWRNNLYVMAAGVTIYVFYIFLDALTLSAWAGAAAIRAASIVIGIGILVGAHLSSSKKVREIAPLLMTLNLGIGLNAIIFLYTSLDDAYYVGLVQECVFACFLLRMSFVKTALAMATSLVFFTSLVVAKFGYSNASIQIVVLTTMTLVCGIGSYLLQKFRRFDFQKVLIIDSQNRQLKEHLFDSKVDNERKLAAMNMLVHFVKTPLHQINGFSDLLVSAGADRDAFDLEQCSDSAKYIKTATADLTRSVNRLLSYHRLDDIKIENDVQPVILADLFEEFSEKANEHFDVRIEPTNFETVSNHAALKTAIVSLADYYREIEEDIEVSINADVTDGVINIYISDNATTLTEAEFGENTKPLTKIDNYLTMDGAKMPMLLRTVARAAEVVGGSFSQRASETGNSFVLALPAAERAANAA